MNQVPGRLGQELERRAEPGVALVLARELGRPLLELLELLRGEEFRHGPDAST